MGQEKKNDRKQRNGNQVASRDTVGIGSSDSSEKMQNLVNFVQYRAGHRNSSNEFQRRQAA